MRNGAWSAFLVIMIGNFHDPDSRLPLRLQSWALAMIAFYVVFFLGTVARPVAHGACRAPGRDAERDRAGGHCRARHRAGRTAVPQQAAQRALGDQVRLPRHRRHVRLRFLPVQQHHAVPPGRPRHLGRAA
ncbi:hypothetical protein LP419_18720 [Massilia sp. H-1]|nr:hypothetical protein LP419_18720 [Massilia sp. H-1]